jgi:hypothetical protein
LATSKRMRKSVAIVVSCVGAVPSYGRMEDVGVEGAA